MAKLTMYSDGAVRSAAARSYLNNLGVDFDEINVDQQPEAVEFLESKDRSRKYHPLPQFYVADALAYENGFKDISNATLTQINERVEEINAANK